MVMKYREVIYGFRNNRYDLLRAVRLYGLKYELSLSEIQQPAGAVQPCMEIGSLTVPGEVSDDWELPFPYRGGRPDLHVQQTQQASFRAWRLV